MLEDDAVDLHALLQEAGGKCWWLGGAAHGGGGCGRRRAAKKLAGNAAGGEEAVGDLGATWRVGKDQDELGEAYPGARWLGHEHVQNACSARALGVHGDSRRNSRMAKTARELMQIHRG